MNKTFFRLVLLVGVVVILWGQFFPKTQASENVPINEQELIKIAQERAGFSVDDKVPNAEVAYLFAGSGGQASDIFSSSKKVVNFLSFGSFAGRVQVVYKAPQYTVYDGKKQYNVKSFKNSIGGILAQSGVELANEDMVDPPVDSQPVKASIKITRVSLTQVEKTEVIAYQTKEVQDNTLERGLKRIDTEGKAGQRKLVYQVRREDGVEVSRELIKDEIVEKPTNKIIRIGTKVIVLSSVRGYATIYNPSNCSVVSANYRKGTNVRITNLKNGASTIKNVDCTWGVANAPDGIVLDLSRSVLSELKYDGSGKGPSVLVEELKK
jgi:hypothetical protein